MNAMIEQQATAWDPRETSLELTLLQADRSVGNARLLFSTRALVRDESKFVWGQEGRELCSHSGHPTRGCIPTGDPTRGCTPRQDMLELVKPEPTS